MAVHKTIGEIRDRQIFDTIPPVTPINKTSKWACLLFVFAALVVSGQSQTQKAAKTDDEIRQVIIAESIASYRGNCPCPYNTDRAGHKCGARSAYSRPGGASPVCYAKDVTSKMIDDYRKRNR